jgi:hypothetical protein
MTFRMTLSVTAVLVFAGITASETAAQGLSAQRLARECGIQGGLIVHLGCGDGTLTAQLHLNDACLVHGLERDAAKVAKAQRHLRDLGLYGAVSVERWNETYLPYTDNLVNLLVAEDSAGVEMREMMRVLAPGGAAYVKTRGAWEKTVKPWPPEIDDWTHFLYDASGNAVASDERVGSPRRVQWTAGPKRARDHDALSSLSAMTSSGGRIFYIFDEGPTSLIHRPPQWKLIARDAFNGVLLWKREIPTWVTHLFFFRTVPPK